MKRTTLKRTAWPRRLVARGFDASISDEKQRLALVKPAQVAIKKIVVGSSAMGKIGDSVATYPKETIVRSEPYRRLIAALPCSHCQIQGYSQAAHPPPTAKGKKETDSECFPLCCTRPGIVGCHAEYDQGKLFQRDEMRFMARIWAVAARLAINANKY